MSKFSATAGIAIGPILFVIALLGVLAVVASAGMTSFGVAQSADRIKSDITTQANLIRSKINECYMQYITNGVNNSEAPCAGDPYPCSDQDNGTMVSALTCPGDPLVGGSQQNIWTGARNAQLPVPTAGFNPWYYMNAGADGGRCIWTSPTGGKTGAVKEGLAAAAAKFTSDEVKYDPDSNSQKFVVVITPAGTAYHSKCTVP